MTGTPHTLELEPNQVDWLRKCLESEINGIKTVWNALAPGEQPTEQIEMRQVIGARLVNGALTDAQLDWLRTWIEDVITDIEEEMHNDYKLNGFVDEVWKSDAEFLAGIKDRLETL